MSVPTLVTPNPTLTALPGYIFAELDQLKADARRRDAAVQAFRDIGWEIPVPKATMYLWISVPHGYTEWEWTRLLLDRCAVVVTPGIAFGPGGTGYFRISLVADETTLTAAIHRIREVL